MSAWSEVRRLAQLRHTELAGSTDNLVPAATLLNAAENATGVRRLARPPGDALLDGAEAAYDRERLRIYYSKADRAGTCPLPHGARVRASLARRGRRGVSFDRS